ncbi:MAG: methionine--tRNA ligase subunit beta [Candidatus Harrisonbacteria bacterium CG10_big_fil_rev_8_21_14_0_10_38_8]|uniref:Methionine--tRNA ligase n=1 Tax=Candidatus Harrisonbacteria bacterium CG10_big_fil_rev_8_21_14_0_10_38_8 TaxID=1974582 RepID=A0A2M6WJV9_9BACT|nr:MAG: methionine--tRNA ligase subunit beta [Candidatus Harrisonbacteria bacterium CG10_big_fil_rev_8_21_14_0_10_38_8]
MINYEDFSKLDLRVAEIISAERIEGADKLLKLTLRVAEEERTVASGIAQDYTPEELVGKQVVLLANLEPRTLRGVESQGMILAASGSEKPILIIPESKVLPGTKIK